MKSKLLFHFTASGFYTALCLASLSLSTNIIILKSKPDWLYFSFLFFSTFLYYNFHKISWFGHHRMLEKQNLKYRWPASYPGLLLLSLIIAFTGCIALISHCINSPTKIILGIAAGFLAFIYNQKIFGRNLRSLKGTKAFTIAVVSIITGVLIPTAETVWQESGVLEFCLYGFAQFFFISALCIAADIRDADEDREDKILTFPISAGLSITKKIIFLLLSIHLVLLTILYYSSFINLRQLESFVLITILSILLIYQLHLKNSYYYFVLSIDGLIASQTICLLLLNY